MPMPISLVTICLVAFARMGLVIDQVAKLGVANLWGLKEPIDFQSWQNLGSFSDS